MPDVDAAKDARRYLSHKIVRAAVIVQKLEAATDPSVTAENPILVVDFGDGLTGMVRPKVAEMGVRATVGDYVVWYDDGDWISVAPKETFEKGYTLLPPNGRPPILMSRDNPNGWKLEELLAALREELDWKNDRLTGATHPIAKAIIAGNRKIIKGLADAESVQRETLSFLDIIGPDQGPRGMSRVSEAPPASEEPPASDAPDLPAAPATDGQLPLAPPTEA